MGSNLPSPVSISLSCNSLINQRPYQGLGAPPPIGGELALHNLRIVAAARRASAERRAVELPPPDAVG